MPISMPRRRSLLAFPLIGITGLIAQAACAPDRLHSPTDTKTTIILLRHADRWPMQKGLNEAGFRRAEALPAALAGVAIDAIYTLDIQRNRETAEPLAKARGLAVTIIAEKGAAERLVRENAGKTVVWVGNTDNLADIYMALGGDGAPPERYGDLFIVKLSKSGPTVVSKTHFGLSPTASP